MFDDLSQSERAKYVCALRASQMVKSGMKVGLGTGSTAYWLVRHLGHRVRNEGLEIQAVPTSSRTAKQAQEEGIALLTLDQAGWLDLTIDGADEFDPNFCLIKGGGGAHLQEKIVAAASDKMVVIADATKEVAQLGAFPLPVEVTPFGANATRIMLENCLAGLGYEQCPVVLRQLEGSTFVTDEKNYIFDLHLGAIEDPSVLSNALNKIPGVVENGLFINMCVAVIIGNTNETTKTVWKNGDTPEIADFSKSQREV